MATRWPKTAQEAPKRPRRRPNRPPRGPPGRHENASIIDFPVVFEGSWHLGLFSIPTARDGPRAPEDPKR
eukprot:2630164-Pyramimonas_sp.AAC.1